ncbi:MAG: TonB-dependent receptor, partial [Vicinamibacteraceae bacterium]
MRRSAAVLLLTTLVVALPAFAQEQRASIEGTVTDSSGAVLPGATVEARSAAGVVVSTVTNDSGIYRFPVLRPGVYDVTATLSGFAAQSVSGINLSLGQILRADLALVLEGVTEQVQVTSEVPLIDVRQSARAANIRDEYIERLPKGRDFTTLVTQAPGANDETKLGGLSIDGASAGENRYVIDGTETTNVRNGTSGKMLVVDFIDEVQVKSSGYQAEYGGATGGVVNVITKSGTNQFHGDAGFYYSGSGLATESYFSGSTAGATDPTGNDSAVRTTTLRLNPTDTAHAEYIDYAADTSSRWEPGFTVGGPLAKDRLWFFGGYQPSLLTIDRSVTLVADQSDVTRTRRISDHHASANVTGQIASQLRLRGTFNSSSAIRDGLLPAIDGTDPIGTLYDIKSTYPNYAYSGSADYIVSPRLLLSARLGYFFQDQTDENIPQGPLYLFGSTTNLGMDGVPADLQRPAGFRSLPTNTETRRDNLNRLDVQADATWYANIAGQHAFKGGMQINRVGNDVFFGETGNRVSLFWDQAYQGNGVAERGEFGYYGVRSNGVDPNLGFLRAGNVESNSVGLFIQDAWTINNRLTLNLGLRTEKEDLPSFNEFSGISFGFGEKIAPRAGFAWDLRGDGRTKVYGSWGIFYDIMKYELPRGSFGGEHWLDYVFTLDTPNWPDLIGDGCIPSCPGTLLKGPIDRRHPSNDPADQTIDPDLKPMKMQEAVAGFEHELFSGVSATVRYVHKQIDVAVED